MLNRVAPPPLGQQALLHHYYYCVVCGYLTVLSPHQSDSPQSRVTLCSDNTALV